VRQQLPPVQLLLASWMADSEVRAGSSLVAGQVGRWVAASRGGREMEGRSGDARGGQNSAGEQEGSDTSVLTESAYAAQLMSCRCAPSMPARSSATRAGTCNLQLSMCKLLCRCCWVMHLWCLGQQSCVYIGTLHGTPSAAAALAYMWTNDQWPQ
jgi:hypothetical protein